MYIYVHKIRVIYLTLPIFTVSTSREGETAGVGTRGPEEVGAEAGGSRETREAKSERQG